MKRHGSRSEGLGPAPADTATETVKDGQSRDEAKAEEAGA